MKGSLVFDREQDFGPEVLAGWDTFGENRIGRRQVEDGRRLVAVPPEQAIDFRGLRVVQFGEFVDAVFEVLVSLRPLQWDVLGDTRGDGCVDRLERAVDGVLGHDAIRGVLAACDRD